MNSASVEAVNVSRGEAAIKQQNSLSGSRRLDFFMLGGLALAVWFALYFLQNDLSPVKSFALALPGISIALGYWVNYPHFMASYKLAYSQGGGFVVQNWFQLIVVPVVMVLFIAISYIFWDASIKDSAAVLFINNLFESLGLATRVGVYPNLSSEFLGYLVIFMYFTVGWHYSKQTFGCMMVYAKLDNYRLTTPQRNLIRYGLLSTWWVTWLYSNCAVGTYPFYNLTIHRLGLPYIWFQAAYVIVGIMFTLIALMFIANYVRQKQIPSWNFLVPMFALLIWHVPLLGNPEYFVVIALFHSLQYFPFVAKVEASRYKKAERNKPMLRLLLFFGVMVVLGYLFFNFIPNGIDQTAKTASELRLSFFLITFILFINIHHYFIDNVLWRFKNKEVRELLFD